MTRTIWNRLGLATMAATSMMAAGPQAAGADVATPTTTWVSVNRDGSPNANCYSIQPSLSHDGRIIAFNSCAPLVKKAPPNTGNVWYRDIATGRLVQVNRRPDGAQPGGYQFSGLGTVSGDGSTVAYASSAHDLVPGDANGHEDVFAYDRATHTNSLVSVSSSGEQGTDFSGFQLNVGRLGTGVAVSYTGRYVAFAAGAPNLVNQDTNGVPDVFWHDRVTGQTLRVSVATDGSQAQGESGFPAISGNGRIVAFTTTAKNLVPGDPTVGREVFVHDMKTGVTSLVSESSTGDFQVEPPGGWGSETWTWAISRDGLTVVFTSDATNFDPRATDGAFHAYVRDLVAGTTTLVGVNRDGTAAGGVLPSVSGRGRFVAFSSPSSKLGPRDTNTVFDVYVLDRVSGSYKLVSVGPGGEPGDAPSGYYFGGPDISANGAYVAFDSPVATWFSGDENGPQGEDCFVRGPLRI